MSTLDWELEGGGTLGEGSEQSPVIYPRPEAEREGGLPAFDEASEGVDESGNQS